MSTPEDMQISDSLFYRVSGTVVFPVNKHTISASSDFSKELARQIALSDSLGYHIVGGMVRGSASPEGSYAWNAKLSQRRRQAIEDLVRQHGQFACVTSDMPEDYQYLVYMMQQAGDIDTERVRELVDAYGSDLRGLKSALRSADHGALWARLLRVYFPSLRAARVVIFIERNRPSLPTDSLGRRLVEVMAIPVRYDELPATLLDTLDEPELIATPTPRREPRREMWSIGTNLLYDVAYMPGYNRFCPIPNIQVEYFPLHGHFTFGGSLECPWWTDYDAHKFFQVRNYQLEARYYLRSGDIASNPPGQGAAFRGWYAKAYTNLGLYSICFDSNRGWEGEGLGLGLGLGYVLPLSSNGHWRLDFGLQVGYLWTKYDPYQWENPVNPDYHDHKYYYKTTLGANLFKKRQHHLNWVGPTRLSITLTYDLLYRRNHRGGASFKNYEIAY